MIGELRTTENGHSRVFNAGPLHCRQSSPCNFAGKHASCLLDADRERSLVTGRAECNLANGDYSLIGMRSIAIQGHGILGSKAIALNWWLAISLFLHLK